MEKNLDKFKYYNKYINKTLKANIDLEIYFFKLKKKTYLHVYQNWT